MTKTIIMAAPNGARKTKSDHPHLPLSIEETVAEAAACHAQGAAMLHAHVRDDEGQHVLDTARYRDLISAMAETCPDMPCQITTEAVGIYSPQDQANCLFDLSPQFASLAISELAGDRSKQALDFAIGTLNDAAEMGISLQFILYMPQDIDLLKMVMDQCQWSGRAIDALFVLGKYNPGFLSEPDELDPFMTKDIGFIRSWSICAFGPKEYDVMVKAAALGGHARVGFENNIFLKSGEIASSSAALVGQLAETLKSGGGIMTGAEARDFYKS